MRQYFLGGQDLEMQTIRRLLDVHAPGCVHDRHLAWGHAVASAYREEIGAAMGRGESIVFVELENDLALARDAVVVVDHHGTAAGRGHKTSLEQVFDLLQLPSSHWTRDDTLVAANDRAYPPGLLAAGASSEEARVIREADRAAQGITAEEEHAAEVAIGARESRLGGTLLIVRLPHARMATVADPLHAATGGPGYEHLLVVSPDEINLDSTGPVIDALLTRYGKERTWVGGDLPTRGFYGRTGVPSDIVGAVEEAILSGDTRGRHGRTV